jgi:hypothetical protein
MNNASAFNFNFYCNFVLKYSAMKKRVLIFLFVLNCSLFTVHYSFGQCSICTRTAQQLGEKPAKALNAGIIYLAFMPMTIIGYIGYRWWRSNHEAA